MNFVVLCCFAVFLHYAQSAIVIENPSIRESSEVDNSYISFLSKQPVRQERLLFKPPFFIPIPWVTAPPPGSILTTTPQSLTTAPPTTQSTTSTTLPTNPGDEGESFARSALNGHIVEEDCGASCCISECAYTEPNMNPDTICTGDYSNPCNLTISTLTNCHNSELPNCLITKCVPTTVCNRICSNSPAQGYSVRCPSTFVKP